MKRGYPWKSSWSSSDLSLTFNQREEEKRGCGKAVALGVTPPPSLPPPSTISAFPGGSDLLQGAPLKLLRSTTHLLIINRKDLRAQSYQEEEVTGVWGVDFTNWHFSIVSKER